MTTLVVHNLAHAQDGPPVVWEGTLEDGRTVNFRYRFGTWSINTGDVSIFSKDRETVASGNSGRGEYDGICTWADMIVWAKRAGITITVVD